MPKYSLIVPVYNCGSYLEPCVESLLGQTFRDFEILLIDDGTPDNGGVLCDQLAAQHDCIRVFHKENGGAASARNYGIERAEGHYLLFVDGDDRVEANMLSTIDKSISNEPDILIFASYFEYYDTKNQLSRVEVLSSKYVGALSQNDYETHFKSLFYDNSLSSVWNKAISSRFLKQHNLYFTEGMTLYEDLEFVLRCFQYAERTVCISTPLYHYRILLSSNSKRFIHYEDLFHNATGLLDTFGAVACVHHHTNEIVNVAVNLYMQLLMRHLLVNRYSAKQISTVVASFCENSMFIKLLNSGSELKGNERILFSYYQSKRYYGLLLWIYKRKIASFLRKNAKRIFRLFRAFH